MKRVVDLTRQEKIELIRKLQTGEANVINGMVIEFSPVIIYNGKVWDEADKYWLGDQEFTPEEFEKVIDLYPEGARLIFLPAKKEIENE